MVKRISGWSIKRRGFTLTEIAIVLGIIGLILGAIWVAASAVYNNLRVSRATTELISTSQTIRSLFAMSLTTGSANGANMTFNLIRAGAFPLDAVCTAAGACGDLTTATQVNTPWANSRIYVYSAQQPAGGVTGDSFAIEFVNIPQSACISLVTAVTGPGRDQGLVGLDFAAGAIGGTIINVATFFTFPSALALIAADCGSALNNVAFTFRLHG